VPTAQAGGGGVRDRLPRADVYRVRDSPPPRRERKPRKMAARYSDILD